MSFSEIFEANSYLHLPNFLDKENCAQYVTEFKKLIDQGHAKKDMQCPLSFSIAGSALFDSLLEQLTPNIEQATGKKLYPTYAYARWYAPGDELKIHKDRPSCEISATITLGFEGNQWPIYVGNYSDKSDARQINMNVGDAVVYKGEELFHWREKYIEGQWQAQVFVHYVDAEGPNKEWKYDKREKLAHHQEKQYDLNSTFLVQQKVFSQKSCEQIIDSFEKNQDKETDALLVGNVLDKTVRDTKKIQLGVNKGIGATLTGVGIDANYFQWQFNITHSNQCEYLRYDKDGHFSSHIDTCFVNTPLETKEMRKLTIIAFLNDDYKGGRLWISTGEQKLYPDTSVGNVIIFPSFFLHGVEPVTEGIRRSVVTWLVGPYLK